MWKEILSEEMIAINPPISSKSELFEKMVNHVYGQDHILNRKKFLQDLLKREKLSNTELAPGVAFPHARSNSVNELFVSIIILKNGVDYGNPDMGKVKIVFFFGCSEGENTKYLQMLAQASRLSRNKKFRNMLSHAKTPQQVIDIMDKFDQKLTGEESADFKYLMILVLNKPELMSDVMSALVETGITNASIVDSVSMARKLAYEIPVFAGLSYIANSDSKSSAMIFSHIRNPRLPQHLANLLKTNGIDLYKKGVGYIQLIKLESIIGIPEEEIQL